MAFTVAIVGRPNVGKSTLFNRLVGKRLALVDDTPGVTRDWREGTARLGDLDFRVLDTAGLDDGAGEALSARTRRQTEAALTEAHLVLFLIDARAGLTPLDQDLARWLRRCKAPVVLVANKVESAAGESGVNEAYALGLGEPIAISAEHGEGMADLYEAIDAHVPDVPAATTDKGPPDLMLAIVGRPNVGKSTLVNRLLGVERVLTGPEPGLTRDSIAVAWDYRGQPIRLVDTAGLRRKSRVAHKLEKLSVAETLRAIRLAQVVVLVIDGTIGIDKQDLTIASHVIEEGRALIVAVNKWDMIDDRARLLAAVAERLEKSLPQARGVPIVTLSAATGHHVDRLLPAVLDIFKKWNSRVTTPVLNRWLGRATERNPPPAVAGRRIRIRYATQVKARPPTFALFASRPEALPESYARYLANGLREEFDLAGVPIRLIWRKGKNPYAED